MFYVTSTVVCRDKALINCKLRDEYSIVKDIVEERDSKRLALVPAAGGHADGNRDVIGMLYCS